MAHPAAQGNRIRRRDADSPCNQFRTWSFSISLGVTKMGQFVSSIRRGVWVIVGAAVLAVGVLATAGPAAARGTDMRTMGVVVTLL
jgi:hypothetical protein